MALCLHIGVKKLATFLYANWHLLKTCYFTILWLILDIPNNNQASSYYNQSKKAHCIIEHNIKWIIIHGNDFTCQYMLILNWPSVLGKANVPSPVTFYNQFLTQKIFYMTEARKWKQSLAFAYWALIALPKFGIISEEFDLRNIYTLKFSEWKKDIGHYLILGICMRIPW